MIEILQTKLLAERRKNLVQEMEIRKEMGDAMLQQLMESEELRAYVYTDYLIGWGCRSFSSVHFSKVLSAKWIHVNMLSRQIEELKESYEEKLENTFEMYKDAIKEHAYQCALNNLEEDYVPLDEFTAEQEKVEVVCP